MRLKAEPATIEMMVKVAKLYYVDQKKKNVIAKTLKVTPTYVALLLERARQNKIVRIEISPPADETTLASQLRTRFGLEDVILVEPADYLGVCANVGKAAAEYFDKHVIDGSQIAMSGGTSILRMIENIQSKLALRIFPTVIPRTGPEITHADSSALSAFLLFKSEAGSKAYGIQLPPTPDSAERLTNKFLDAKRELEKEKAQVLKENEQIAELYTKLISTDFDFVFLACGPLRRIHLAYTLLDALEARGLTQGMLEASGIIGNVNYWLVNAKLDGLSPFLAVSPERLQDLVKSKRRVVLVAGSTFKTDIIWLYLVKRLCNVLITDTQTAAGLLNMPKTADRH